MAFLKPASMNASKNLVDVKSEHVTNLSQGKLELEPYGSLASFKLSLTIIECVRC